MDTLTTKSGKTFDCDYFNPFPPVGQINLRVLNSTISEVAKVFSDPEETAYMFCSGQHASNYTSLVALVPEGQAIRVVLKKE